VASESINKSKRTAEQIREHYEVEKSLANQLKSASKEERHSSLNVFLHEELFRRVPHHPLLTKKLSPADRKKAVEKQMRKFAGLLEKDICFLEIGPGDCALSFEVSRFVRQVYAVDVNKILTENDEVPDNFELLISNGCSIPVPEKSVDIGFSNQLMEHLHPDDAYEQLENVYRALVAGGVYFCDTPNRLNGPHDISRGFDENPTGFHLKEYTVTELSELLKKAGFAKVKMCTRLKGSYFRLPTFPAKLCEHLLQVLPVRPRKILANSRPVRALINVSLIGIKGN